MLRQRMQPNDLQATRQGLGQLREKQHVGGSGENEAARYATAVHFNLDGFEQIRDALHLVQDDALGQFGNEAQGVGARALSHRGVVEADVGVVAIPPGPPPSEPIVSPCEEIATPRQVVRGAGELGKRRLAALARAVNQHDRRVFQCLRESALDRSRIEVRRRHRLIVTFSLG